MKVVSECFLSLFSRKKSVFKPFVKITTSDLWIHSIFTHVESEFSGKYENQPKRRGLDREERKRGVICRTRLSAKIISEAKELESGCNST
jgi:hypothetical protein